IIGALLSMWKPRDNTQSGQPTVRRGLVNRLRKSRAYFWLIQQARAFLKEQAEERAKAGLVPRTQGVTPETHPELYIATRGHEFWTPDDLHAPGDGLKKKQKQQENFQVGADESFSEASARLDREKAERQGVPPTDDPPPTPAKPPEQPPSSFAEWRNSVLNG